MPDSSNSLKEGARYGELPFDRFVLEKWDYEKPVDQDKAQWRVLAQAYLDLDAKGRHPYNQGGDEPLPELSVSAAQAARVLIPHQTVRERNYSLGTDMGRYNPVWLRTCYSPDLEDTYAGFAGSVMDTLGDYNEFNDEALYADCADDWSRVLLRVPAIADTVRYYYEDDDNMQPLEQIYPPPREGQEFLKELYDAKVAETTMLYLIDEEALRTDFIKVLWLDIHGKCVWDNRIHPGELLQFTGHMFDGNSLANMQEIWWGDNPSESDVPERGAILDYF